MNTARILVVVVGILLPYLARIPGALMHGSAWLTDYLAGGTALLFFAAFNAIAWGCILLSTITYRSPHAVWFPAVCGFGFLALVHGTYDLRSDAQAAIGLVFIPLYSLPFVLIGWLLGKAYEHLRQRPVHEVSAKL